MKSRGHRASRAVFFAFSLNRTEDTQVVSDRYSVGESVLLRGNKSLFVGRAFVDVLVGAQRFTEEMDRFS